MPRQLSCARGHRWPVPPTGNGERADDLATCPVCGAAAKVGAPAPAEGGGSEAVALPPQPARDNGTVTPPPTPVEEAPVGEAVAPVPADAAGTTVSVPGYEVLGELGRGGMGVVYKARQAKLNRVVALKMILAAGHAGEADLARFRTEAEAIARLQHPNVVQIYEIGEYEGRPFFSLEFCPGGSLADRLGGTPLPPREASRLVETLARAMHAAHQAGVVHRDLKPANVLLAADGTPKVTDFGLAKRLDAAGRTATGAVLGTPSYMAPEQAGGRSKETGPATDVYALGAILYELLTGRPPFKAATPLGTLLQVQTDEPVPPGRLVLKLPRDLGTVCLKCLHKEPTRRYASAADLADDLGRFRRGESIRARPVGAAGRAARWARRNPAVAGLLGAVAAALLLGTAVASFFAVQARAQRRQAEQNAQEARAGERLARQYLYLAKMQLAQSAWRETNIVRLLELLAEAQPRAGEEDLRGWEWHYLWRLAHADLLTLRGHTNVVTGVCFSPDGTRLASASQDGMVKVWDARTGQEQLTLQGHSGAVSGVCFSPDGRRLASASEDGTVKVWDAHTGQEQLALKGHNGAVQGVAFSPDGTRLASASDQTVKVWDAQTGQEQLTLKGHTSAVYGVCFSPDGTRLASASDDQTVRVWEARTGREERTLRGHTGPVYGVCFSPDGTRLASASRDGTVKVWDARTGQELRTLTGHTDWVQGVCFSPDGQRLASASWDGAVKVWDPRTGQEAFSAKGHTGPVRGVCFSPDGTRLASASGWLDEGKSYGEVKVWDAQTGQEQLTLQGGGDPVCFSPDGRRLASASEDGTVKVWDAQTGQEQLTLKGHTGPVTGVCFSPDGRRLVSASLDKTVKVWDVHTGQEALTLKGHTDWVWGVCFSPDGSRLASASEDGTVKLWDARPLQEGPHSNKARQSE